MNKSAIIIISGPTAVGKSKLAIELAEYNGEIISADSMQVYRYLDIGTAKPEKELLNKVKHHLINIKNPDEEYNAFDFVQDAEKAIKQIYIRGKFPYLVGGTGLYLRSLVYGLSEVPGRNEEIREHLEKQVQQQGLNALYTELSKVDHKYASVIDKHDPVRIIRALEVYHLTGKPFSCFADKQNRQPRYNVLWLGLNMERSKLYARIDQRTEMMYNNGLIRETASLLRKGYSAELISKKGIGYSEVIDFIQGKISKQEAVEITSKKTRNYAKRQLTWFKKEKLIKWFDSVNVQKIKKYIREWQRHHGYQ